MLNKKVPEMVLFFSENGIIMHYTIWGSEDVSY